MQRISVYDDTNEFIEAVCDELDMSEPELIEELIEYYVDTQPVDDSGIVRLYKRMFESS